MAMTFRCFKRKGVEQEVISKCGIDTAEYKNDVVIQSLFSHLNYMKLNYDDAAFNRGLGVMINTIKNYIGDDGI